MQTTYNTTKNSGILWTEDSFSLIFEGIRRPGFMGILRDSAKANSSEDIIILERYFSDIQNLFLKKLSAFAISDAVTEGESVQLRALLEEMIKVKQLIQQQALSVNDRV